MFYQNILNDVAPYDVRIGILGGFGEHRHADVELHYCIEGEFDVTLNKETHHVSAGDLLFISPMTSHAFPVSVEPNRRVLTMIFGISFLKKHFSTFSRLALSSPVFHLNTPTDKYSALKELLEEIAQLCLIKESVNELFIQGDLYKVCAHLLRIFDELQLINEESPNSLRSVANIEKALELIYYRYTEPITLDDAANVTGYGKSNFCKIFKNIVGDTFHNTLNRRRIDNSCSLLEHSDLSIAEISRRVGFCETKTFCRVFRSFMNMTPGEYRKKNIS